MGRKIAMFFSVIFHPMLMITYGLVIYLLVNPFAFGVPRLMLKSPFLIMVFILTFFFPVLVVVLLRQLKFVDSITLRTSKERIIPYIATAVFLLWMYITTRSNPEIPLLYKAFVLGSVISLFIVFFINNFSKISAHMAGAGGMLMFSFALWYGKGGDCDFTVIMGNNIPGRILNFPSVVLLLSGIIASSRLKLQSHSYQEILGGFIAGVLGQLIALKSYF